MRYLLILFFSLSLCEDTYPYFSDMYKQLTFERHRIYITEKSSERMKINGGESYSEMANPLGYIFFNEDPNYVAKNKLIETKYTYYSEFNITKNSNNISEIEFFKIIGLKEEANKIFKEYTNALEKYNNGEIEKAPYIKQTLSNDMIKSMAESYNIKIYNEIVKARDSNTL